MHTVQYKLIELFIIFILLPIAFALKFPVWIKMSIGFLGFLYIIFVLLKVESVKFRIASNLNWRSFWRETAFKLAFIGIVTTCFVWYTDKESFFDVFLNKTGQWFIILFIYSFFSVYPQELIYRTFFFKRYEGLIKGDRLIIFINAIVFSLGHIFFRNTIVLALTFLGGLLFAISFHKTKSTLLVSIEHAIYGCWLFTVGMGNMLGFPS